MTKGQTGSITVRLGTMREPFARVCDARGVSVSNCIRQLVAETLEEKKTSAGLSTFDDDESQRVRLNLRLTSQEYLAIQQRVEADGFSSANRWIIALIRANLQREPEFGETGLDALYESNRILSPLARNLNQLARDIHQNGSRIPAYRFQILENLQKIIPAHINVIARVISRNVGRWRTE